MGKKSRKKTTWRKLSLQDESEVKGNERLSTKSSEEGCECSSGEGRGRGNGSGSRFNSISAKKSFLSSRKYRHYSAADYNSGCYVSRNVGSAGDDASTYTANDDSVFADEGGQQGSVYFQPPFVYPCFITPTLVLPPYHPSQWYEDPRFPYDQHNYICLTQPLNPPAPTTNSCSSPDTGSDVGYSSSSPPIAPGQTNHSQVNNNNNINSRVSECGGETTPGGEEEPTNYHPADPTDDPYAYPHPAFFHPLHPDQPPLLPDDQSSSSSYFYPGTTTYVLKPVAIVRRTPPPESWWESEFNGGGNGVRRRRRRNFIGGEGITYDRWPSRIHRDTYREMDECRDDEYRGEEQSMGEEEFPESCAATSFDPTKSDNQVDSIINHNNSQVPGSEFQSNNEVEASSGECNNKNVDVVEDSKSPQENVEVREEEEETLKESVPVQSASPTFHTSVQDPVKYSKYYQISAVDEEEMVLGSLEEGSELRKDSEEDSEFRKGLEDVPELGDGSGEDSSVRTGHEDVSEPLKSSKELIDVSEEDSKVPKDSNEGSDERAETETSPAAATELSSMLEPMEEIVVHEVSNGSSSECGSEDVEMLGHRYESAADKLYKANTLSLAAELMDSSEQLFTCDPHLNQLMERSKRVALTGTTGGYLSNTRQVMESYCTHLAPAGMNNGQGKEHQVVNFDEEEVDGDVDCAVMAVEDENQINSVLSGARQSGLSPLVFLRTKGPWHGCCCSIM